MAMMTTGRVLLVCALCVLWCGAGGGGRAETPSSPSLETQPEKSTQKKEEVVAGDVDQSSKPVAPKEPTPKASELPEKPANSLQPQQPGGASKAASPTTDSMVQNTEGKNEEEEEEGDDTKEKEETKKEEETVTSITGGISAGGQEQPSLSSAAEGASNITNPNSTQTTGDGDPAADGAGTAEGKQNENKDANPKETPVTAAAMKTTTATTGNSDGSTAVSHTTSPLLLLLLVVACAAAVVAA
ncbi:Mucin-associated surface protein (MASP) [Trypanosoma cruzi]|uniref:Mucin-associated surface protein (MASP), putative n=2 Tax=Trypanosoma cruzi TaxID=5693 RepID=Q4D033_TRYCC|nr:mucin-associated surface protein (MASP), putative [Trypanosoma cruzi]EAN85888.1 mucin-associated surface protein (MASP), putative [Trypanosoma cruzi]PWV20614.1 Mucin-associated surface protein (MASP) [Trypanosoma cruzi]|eukprot:XP_807739.1 mucin-associated surface protein (MASP) [Trypanosoma cruzi strain CL Brener]